MTKVMAVSISGYSIMNNALNSTLQGSERTSGHLSLVLKPMIMIQRIYLTNS